MPAPPCMEAAVPDDTAYDQLQLLCLRESGAATELLKGTKALNLRTPELSALVQDMLEAQRVFVCALGRWTEHTAGPAARRLAGKLAGEVGHGADVNHAHLPDLRASHHRDARGMLPDVDQQLCVVDVADVSRERRVHHGRALFAADRRASQL